MSSALAGTALLLTFAGTPWFMLSALPAAVACTLIMLGWRRYG